MRTAILGCGAMGTVLGAYLTRCGCPVEMIDAYAEHVTALQNKGATVIGHANFTVPVKALLPEEMEGIYDLVFLFTKQTANDKVLPQLLPHLSSESVVCTLQNGIPEPHVAEWIGQERTVGGTVLWGATFCGPGVSELTQDITKRDCLYEVGTMDGTVDRRIQMVAEILGKMGTTQISTSLMESRWSKLLANACMSGMSAACGCNFGQILDNEMSSACLSYLGHEVKLCCEAEGYKLSFFAGSDSLSLLDQTQFLRSQQMFHDIYDCQPSAKASMLQDLEHGRPTEVKMINGYICKIGDRHGIDTPFNDAVVDIVTKIERGELPLSMENLQRFPRPRISYTAEKQ